MKVVCPSCGSGMSSQDLRIRWRGGSECPLCGAALRWSPPYHLIALWGSFPILVFFIATEGIPEGPLSILTMVVTWLLESIAVAVVLGLIKPPKLKLARDNSAPPTLFGKRD